MGRRHHKPEETVAKLRQVEVLTRQGKPVADAVRSIGVTEATYYRGRTEYGGLKLDQVRRLKVLEQENGRLRKAVDLMSVFGPGEPGREVRPGRCPGPAKGGALGTSLSVFAASAWAPLHPMTL